MLRPAPTASHRLAAAAHHLLLEVELPMSAMVAAVVWLVLYPSDANAARALERYTNLTSLTMHAANLVFMLLEFALDALHVDVRHVGLVVAWGMLYALFNGLQAWLVAPHDIVYFFMDFTLVGRLLPTEEAQRCDLTHGPAEHNAVT